MRRLSSLVLAAALGLAAVPAGAQDFLRNLTFQQKPAVGVIQARPGDLVVSAEFDRPDGVYAKGETVRMSVRASRDSYVAVVTVGPTGDVGVLYPNAVQKAAKIPANTTLEIPPPGATHEIAVTPPYGIELVAFVVSDRPLEIFTSEDLVPAGSYASVKGGVATLIERAGKMPKAADRAVVVIERQLTTLETRPAGVVTKPQVLVNGQPPATAAGAATSDATAPKPKPAFALPKLENPFRIDVQLDRDSYRVGDKPILKVVSTQTCYLSVYEIGGDEVAMRVYPNKFNNRTAVVAANPVQIGGAASPAQLEVRAPGPVRYVAVCSTEGAPVTAAAGDAEATFVRVGDGDSLGRDLEAAARRPAGSTAMTMVQYVIAN